MSLVLSVTKSRSSGVAPLAVIFEASGTTDSATAIPFHDCVFEWDFGDGESGSWSYGVMKGCPKNHETSPVAGHIYEAAGTYIITLKVHSPDGTTTATTTDNVTVTDPNTIYSGTNTICFSTDGDFTGAPYGCTQVTTSNPYTWFNANKASLNSKRLLFKRGQTFSPSAGMQLGAPGGLSGGTFGAFGAGANPMLQAQSNSQYIISATSGTLANNCNDWRVMDIDFDAGSYTGVRAVLQGTYGDMSNQFAGSHGYWTILRCNVVKANNPFSISAAGSAIADCTVSSCEGGAGGNSLWSQDAHYQMVCGNSFNNSDLGEHVYRSQGSVIQIVAHNDFKRPNTSKQVLTVRGTYGTTAYATQYVVARNNNLLYPKSGNYNTISPQNTTVNEPIMDVIWEGNYFGTPTSKGFDNSIYIHARNITLRNNIFDLSSNTGVALNGVNIGNSNTGGTVYPDSIYIFHNTFYSGSVGGNSAVRTSGAYQVGAVTLKNNVAYCPSATKNGGSGGSGPSFYYNDNTYSTPPAVTQANNSSDVQMHGANPFVVTTPSSLSEHRVSISGYAKSSGTSVIRRDMTGKIRGSSSDLGAFECVRDGYRYGPSAANVI